MTVAEDFPELVKDIVGPLLDSLGFVLDGVDDAVDEGGRIGSVVYYRGSDCRLQVYWSTRAGEVNCMIAPIAAKNTPGLYDRSGEWHYLKEFIAKPNLSLEELVKKVQSEKSNFETRQKWLWWLRSQIASDFETARAAILERYGFA